MNDQSHLDNKYFVDKSRYNCPFCRRRHVVYALSSISTFNWNTNKKCYIYIVACESCGNSSMHLSFQDIYEPKPYANGFRFTTNDIDSKLFYSVPTSLHSIDDRIPRKLRELLTEAEGCQKSNFLTGASACARKLIYELAVAHGAEGDNYEDRIKSLKLKLPQVDGVYFDTLLTLQQVTSSKVHEESYEGWDSQHLRVILSALYEALREIYVVPKEREARRKQVLALKDEVLAGPQPAAPDAAASPAGERGATS